MPVAIVPARYESVRFPAKVLADATGKPLIRHVMEAAARASRIDHVVCATDDERVRRAVVSFGGEVVMTRPDHINGTSRLAEAAVIMGLNEQLVVNVQGDEPEIEPASIDAAIARLEEDSTAVMSTIAAPFDAGDDPNDPNIVKVVLDRHGRALYFSRAAIPHARVGGTALAPLKHVGLYVYRATFLKHFPELAPTPLETSECLEQLRVLEHGERIAVAIGAAGPPGIDTPEQYAAFVERERAAR